MHSKQCLYIPTLTLYIWRQALPQLARLNSSYTEDRWTNPYTFSIGTSNKFIMDISEIFINLSLDIRFAVMHCLYRINNYMCLNSRKRRDTGSFCVYCCRIGRQEKKKESMQNRVLGPCFFLLLTIFLYTQSRIRLLDYFKSMLRSVYYNV